MFWGGVLLLGWRAWRASDTVRDTAVLLMLSPQSPYTGGVKPALPSSSSDDAVDLTSQPGAVLMLLKSQPGADRQCTLTILGQLLESSTVRDLAGLELQLGLMSTMLLSVLYTCRPGYSYKHRQASPACQHRSWEGGWPWWKARGQV